MRYPCFQALKRMREYDRKIAEGEAKARALTQQRELRDQVVGREAEPTSSSEVDHGSESSFSSMSVGIKSWIRPEFFYFLFNGKRRPDFFENPKKNKRGNIQFYFLNPRRTTIFGCCQIK